LKTKWHTKNDYRQLKTKMVLRILLMGVISFILINTIYMLYLYGRLANGIVAFLETIFHMDYDSALNLYQQVIRNNIGWFYLVTVFITFLILFTIFLNGFIKYFYEINRGIDALVSEKSGEIVLLPELSATEKKLNTVRQTLEKQKLETMLAEQRKNDLIVYLAHDLKTPLTSVIGYLSLLRDEPQISNELREKYLRISLDKAERLEELINEFFEITRFNLSNVTLEISRVNLTRMLQQLIFEFKPMLSNKNLKCTLNAKPEIMIKCDVDKMQRVFDNLLRNAVNYSFEDSVIDIQVTLLEHVLKINFINHGNTISREKLSRLFEQFYRLDSARVTKTGGAGLGLAIAKEIVELHGGEITARSANELIDFELVIPVL